MKQTIRRGAAVYLALMLLAAFMLSSCSSGNETASSAYKNISLADEVATNLAKDMENICEMCLYGKMGDYDVLEQIAIGSHYISEDDVRDGVTYAASEQAGADGENIDEFARMAFRSAAENLIRELDSEEDFMGIIYGAYFWHGKITEVNTAMTAAKESLSELNKKNHKNEYREALEEYYLAVIDLMEYCNNPGSDLMGHSDDLRDLTDSTKYAKSRLEFAFE